MISDSDCRLLRGIPRPIVHMRQQIERERFGLCLGAGIGRSLGFPNWQELVDKIARSPSVRGESVGDASISQTSRTQMLFQHFRSRRLLDLANMEELSAERVIAGEWVRLIHDCLYEGATTDDAQIRHPYLEEFLDVVRRSTMTVNYNFDDSLERMLAASRDESQRDESRGYEVVWQPSTQFRVNRGVVYHPNGFLPFRLIEGFSAHIVFGEESFADQLIDSMAGHYSCLLNHLSKNTCLFLGISLVDPTLKHLLRQSARLNPGHCHYYVAFVPPRGPRLSTERQQAIRTTNFEVYNLITLFLSEEEIAGLGRLLSAPEDVLEERAEREDVPLSYCFYLSGAVGAGKTTAVQFFNSLDRVDEWIDPKLPLLAREHTSLSPEERAEVDVWVANQFRKKNFALNRRKMGIQVVDRCPLDPLAFSREGGWRERAQELSAAIRPERSRQRVRAGEVLLLLGEEVMMLWRTSDRQKLATLGYIKRQQQLLAEIYDIPGVRHVKTQGMDIQQVVKRIARLIHLEPFTECDLEARLEGVQSGSVVVGGGGE